MLGNTIIYIPNSIFQPMKLYLDYASSTPIDPCVLKAMLPHFNAANPSSLHQAGKKAKKAVEEARHTVAKILKCKPEEIIFTSSGTESINLALKGVKKGHIITSKIEHPAVLETCKFLATKHQKIVTQIASRQNSVNCV